MLTIPAGTLSTLLPANTQLAAVTLPRYRELLRKLKANGGAEESSNAFQQAKQRVLLRLQQRRERARLDPNGAFRRLSDRLLQARLSLRELKNEQKARLRQYYLEALRGTAAAAAVGVGAGREAATAAAAPPAAPALGAASQLLVGGDEVALDPEAVQHTLGPNGLFRSVVIATVGTACKAFLHGASQTTITGQEHMRAALERPAGQALITVSNHVGSIDDPLITSAVVPQEYLLRPEAVRWTMCATDRCFKSRLLAPFFKAAKVLPVERGAGLSQYGMRVAQSRLSAGDWVHIFPEGTRSRTGKMGPVRKGVGWLVASCETPPLVLPFVHSGMERVCPKGAKLPRTGQDIRIAVGEPVSVADLLAAARQEGWSEDQLHVAIADRVGQALYSLKAQLEGLPVEEVAPQRAAAAVTISEETLLPLIEEEMDSMLHRWRDSWQRSGLPSLTARLREALREQAAAHCDFEEQEGAGSSTGAAAAEAASMTNGSGEGGVRRGAMLRMLSGQQGVLSMLRGARPAGAARGGPATPDLALATELAGMGPAGGAAAGTAGSAQLRALLSAAADYSNERMQRMQQLVGGGQVPTGPSLAL